MILCYTIHQCDTWHSAAVRTACEQFGGAGGIPPYDIESVHFALPQCAQRASSATTNVAQQLVPARGPHTPHLAQHHSVPPGSPDQGQDCGRFSRQMHSIVFRNTMESPEYCNHIHVLSCCASRDIESHLMYTKNSEISPARFARRMLDFLLPRGHVHSKL